MDWEQRIIILKILGINPKFTLSHFVFLIVIISHKTDNWLKLINIDQPITNTALYTARGHGDSDGWQKYTDSHPFQFCWDNLANDMIDINHYFKFPYVIYGGNSMGSATALYAAANSTNVTGVILIRPPTAWEKRIERRQHLLTIAENLLNFKTENSGYYVYQSTAYANLPPIDDISFYNKITCPVLILTIEGDDTHPVETAQILSRLIPNVELHIAENNKMAREVWPDIVSKFITKILL